MTIKTYFVTSLVFAIVCVVSAVMASSSAVTGDSYDGLGRAVYATVFITLPAFAIALTASLVGGFLALRRRRR